LEELVEKKNEWRRKIPYWRMLLWHPSEEEWAALQRKGMSKGYVPKPDERVFFNNVANLSRGADCEDVTDRVHRDFRILAERAAQCFDDLAFCGVDVISEDITAPSNGQAHAVIEVNSNSGPGMHHFPSIGAGRDVAGKIMDHLFPDAKALLSACEIRTVIVTVRGKVKKVGYRRWVRRHAVLHGLVGDITNCKDNAVRIRMEGMANPVEHMIALCARGPTKARPGIVEVEQLQKRLGCSGFSIIA
jgi:acylphosphatase